MNVLNEALSYAKQGWHVFPLKPKDKVPLTKNGFKDATTDEAQIRAWWKKHPTANIGIATGAVSGLVVIDFDPRNGGDVHAFMREHGDILAKFRFGKSATGGGGMHWFFRYTSEPIGDLKDVMPGVDVKSDGGYVVAPPSIHPNGNKYEWLQ